MIAARLMLDSEVTASRFIRMETMIAAHTEEENGTSESFEFLMHSSIRSTVTRFSEGFDRGKGVRTVVNPKGA